MRRSAITAGRTATWRISFFDPSGFRRSDRLIGHTAPTDQERA